MKLIYSTNSYQYMLDGILKHQKINIDLLMGHEKAIPGLLTRKQFPDGEIYHKFGDDLEGNDVIIIGGTISDSETMELFDMACSAAKHGAKTLTIIIPYFGYATMERAVQSGEIVKAKTRARLLSAIPMTTRNKIAFVDLHSEGIPHYLEGGIQPNHIYAKPHIMDLCFKLAGEKFVLGSTDAGRAKWVESLANDMKVDCAIIIKRRISGSETLVSGINADVKGKNVVIYDDMIRTGGSLINAAKSYKDAGAAKVYAIATHGILPGDSLIKLYDSRLFEKIGLTNTHPRTIEISKEFNGSTFFVVEDISPLLYRSMISSKRDDGLAEHTEKVLLETRTKHIEDSVKAQA